MISRTPNSRDKLTVLMESMLQNDRRKNNNNKMTVSLSRGYDFQSEAQTKEFKKEFFQIRKLKVSKNHFQFLIPTVHVIFSSRLTGQFVSGWRTTFICLPVALVVHMTMALSIRRSHCMQSENICLHVS